MRMRIFFFCFLSLLFSNSIIGQLAEGHRFHPSLAGANSWKYSPDLSEEELYQYDRLLYMSREDWDMFRTDPRYNEDHIREIYKAHKGKLTQGLRMGGGATKSNDGDCECWIEPDATYTESDPNGWSNSGGGGPGVDVWFGPIQLPFNFCFFGQNYNQIALTSKGTIVMGPAGYIDWTPSEFPNPLGNEDSNQYDQIAAFWADFDFRATGQLFYKVTDEAFYLNFIDVGYFANHDNLTNTFQIILAAEDSGILPNGNNVQFCYQDMQWAHGDVGGSGGFSGPTPANVGADRITGTSHVQFGRFNLNNGNYNGPYGINNNQQDGVNWLDNKELNFSTCLSASNIPPLSTVSAPCDTIVLCQGQVYDLNMQFLSPEAGQVTTITTTQTSTGLSATAQNGNTANLTASFTASAANIGINTVTITATDNGAGSAFTTLTYVFDVTSDVPPAINISGELGVCAGGTTLLSATPGFDSYSWSTGCDTQDCTVSQGGNITVTGFSGGCSSTATVFVDASTYFIPDFVTGNEPISLCPGVTQEICLEEEWESYTWAVYTGYEGNIPAGAATNQQCFEFSGNNPGFYSIIVTDENGCQGLNIQEVIQIESFIDEANEDLSGAYCDGLESVSFTGGFSNPAQGDLLIYAQDGSANGWQGAYLNVVITHADGTTDTYLVTATTSFTISSAPITLGDTWTFTYVSNGNATQDANNSFWAINCNGEIWNSVNEIGPGLTPGIVYQGVSSCAPSELSGEWTVTGPAGWSLTTTTAYNPINAQGVSSPNVFTPGDYGLYTLCFTDPECNLDYCYELEYTEAPELTLTPNTNALLCGNETLPLAIEVVDIGGTGEIEWTGNGVVPSSNGLNAVAGPYTGYVTSNVQVSITNGCGSDNGGFTITHQPNVPQPSLQDAVICNSASTNLDPVPSNQDNSALQYAWTPGNQTSATLNVSTPGTYCVTVSNLCGTSQQECATITNVPTANAPQLQANILECDESTVTLSTVVPAGYSIAWSNGQTNTNSITVEFSGNYCFSITDNQGCNTEQESCANVIISRVPTTFEGSADVSLICPTECEVLNLQATDATSYTWQASCSEVTPLLGNGSVANVCSDLIPANCQFETLQIVGTASNVCGSSSTTFLVIADACAVKIPNVITPNGDAQNNAFKIEGLELYPGSRFQVFDRNGSIVYESENYGNNWSPRDLNEGTYFYILELPFGRNTLFKGTFTLLK
jgi:gliding motility-associated-like protein